METFKAADDEFLAKAIDSATSRVVYVAPGVGKAVAEALVRAMDRPSFSVTIVLDSEEDPYRIGYGDPEGLSVLHDAVTRLDFQLRRQDGLRIGLLAVDEHLIIWAPTARSVEPERKQQQPNAIVVGGSTTEMVVAAVGATERDELEDEVVQAQDQKQPQNQEPLKPEIGREPLAAEEIEKTLDRLEKNPPAPFDLAQKTRVFATRFQFVEFEVQGAEWTRRQIKLSSLLLNADLPEDLQDILDTRVRPFQQTSSLAFKVPHFVNGRPAFESNGSPMMVPATQAEMGSAWAGIRDRYLRHLKGFGWLIKRDQLGDFRAEAQAYEDALKAWVESFRAHAEKEEDRLVESIVESIGLRLERSSRQHGIAPSQLRKEVQEGLQRLRVIDPRVRIIVKDVSWESSRDEEFMSVLEKSLPKADLEGWYEEFTAARQRPGEST